jgi:small subunit ribosomal protein S6
MRHYEIILIVHPDQSEQVPAMLERYTSLINSQGGTVHLQEDWGRRQLAYPIANMHKGHYLLFKVSCSQQTLTELDHAFRFNDAIVRSLVVRSESSNVEPTTLAKDKQPSENEASAAA